MGKPIYSMTAVATIIKNKRPQRRDVWIISTYDNPLEIMRHDKKTMSRLRRELIGSKAKNTSIVINSINSKKQVGVSNHE